MSIHEIERRIREAIQPTPTFTSSVSQSKVAEPTAIELVSSLELLKVFDTASEAELMTSETKEAHPNIESSELSSTFQPTLNPAKGSRTSDQISISHLLEVLQPEGLEDEATYGLTPIERRNGSSINRGGTTLSFDEHVSAGTSDDRPMQLLTSELASQKSPPKKKTSRSASHVPPQKSKFSKWLQNNRNDKGAAIVSTSLETAAASVGNQSCGNGRESSFALNEGTAFNTANGEEDRSDDYEHTDTQYYDQDNDDLLACLAQFSEAGEWWDGRERLQDNGGPWWNRALLDEEPSDTGFDAPSWTSADARPPPPRFRSAHSNEMNPDVDDSSLVQSSPQVPWPRPRNDALPRTGWGFLAIPQAPVVAPAGNSRHASSAHRAGRWGGEGCGTRRYYKASRYSRGRSNNSNNNNSSINSNKQCSVPAGSKSKRRNPAAKETDKAVSTWAPCWGVII